MAQCKALCVRSHANLHLCLTQKSIKCTWPRQAPMQGDPMQPILHLLALGAHWGDCHSRWVDWHSRWVDLHSCWVCKAFRYQHLGIGNTKVSRWGVLPNAKPQREGVRIAVEYRLYMCDRYHRRSSTLRLYSRDFRHYIILVT